MPKIANQDLAKQIGQKVEPVHMKHYTSEQTSIIRQSSIKSAVELVSTMIPSLEIIDMNEIVAETLEIAEKFEEWVKRQN